MKFGSAASLVSAVLRHLSAFPRDPVVSWNKRDDLHVVFMAPSSLVTWTTRLYNLGHPCAYWASLASPAARSFGDDYVADHRAHLSECPVCLVSVVMEE